MQKITTFLWFDSQAEAGRPKGSVMTMLGKFLSDKDPEKSGRVMKAMLQMGKLDINALQRAYDGK
jgi:predicted 3-demethylubiquinone-9 3-methyltransferase (glyoxalase superfamily)